MHILCLTARHRATSSVRSQGGSLWYFRCVDCNRLVVAPTAPGAGRIKAARVTPSMLQKLPLEQVEALRKAHLVGLHPPAPWPKEPCSLQARPAFVPTGGFHGGDLPGNPDLDTPEGRATLQAMLPKANGHAVLPQTEEEAVKAVKDCGGDVHNILDLLAQMDTQLRERLEHQKCRRDIKDQVWSAAAQIASLLGTCCRLKVGCVLIAKDGGVAGVGYNGAGPGMPHCEPDTCNENCRCGRTLHAEQNALAKRKDDPYTAYVTHEPCLNCTKELAVAGVRRVVWGKPYTSIADQERKDRQEWIDYYRIEWMQLPVPEKVKA